MKYIWHRGFHTKRKEENKMPALLKGLNDANSLGIETDIRVTKDQVFVLYHDPLFKGKLINNTLYKEMKKEGIPKLSELLAIETDKILLLEIKDFNLNVNSLLKLLNKHNRNIYLMSFNNKIKESMKYSNLTYIVNNEIIS